jgi:hypothetical protein
MGGCSSSEANGPELQRSKEIDKMLKEVSLFQSYTCGVADGRMRNGYRRRSNYYSLEPELVESPQCELNPSSMMTGG